MSEWSSVSDFSTGLLRKQRTLPGILSLIQPKAPPTAAKGAVRIDPEELPKASPEGVRFCM